MKEGRKEGRKGGWEDRGDRGNSGASEYGWDGDRGAWQATSIYPFRKRLNHVLKTRCASSDGKNMMFTLRNGEFQALFTLICLHHWRVT
jgi:hypothetical protein